MPGPEGPKSHAFLEERQDQGTYVQHAMNGGDVKVRLITSQPEPCSELHQHPCAATRLQANQHVLSHALPVKVRHPSGRWFSFDGSSRDNNKVCKFLGD